MKNNIYPKNYKSLLDLVETQKAIKLVKDTFERELARELDLIRVSAPLFVEPGTGLNDNLSGYYGGKDDLLDYMIAWKYHLLSILAYESQNIDYCQTTLKTTFQSLED